jgi:hypothetical protein
MAATIGRAKAAIKASKYGNSNKCPQWWCHCREYTNKSGNVTIVIIDVIVSMNIGMISVQRLTAPLRITPGGR